MNQSHNQANAVVTAGLCTAIAIVLSMLGLYIPVSSLVVSWLIPLPIMYVGMKLGTRWSLIVTAGTVILSAAFFGALSRAVTCASLALLGTAMGVCYQRQVRPALTLLVSAAAVLAGWAAQALFAVFIMGVSLDTISGAFFGMFDIPPELLAQFYSGETLTQVEQSVKTMQVEIRKTIYFSALAAPVMYGWIEMTIARLIFRRLGMKDMPGLPPLARWQMPPASIYVYLFAIGASLIYKGGYVLPYEAGSALDLALYNLGVACSFIFLLQGISIVWWLPERYKGIRPFRALIVAAAFFIPLVQTFMIIMGVFDMVMHYRERHQYK